MAVTNVSSDFLLWGFLQNLPWKPPWHREPRDEIPQPLLVPVILPRVKLLKRTLQPKGSQSSRGTVAGANDMDHVDIVVTDEKVEM